MPCDHRGKLHRQVRDTSDGNKRKLQCLECMEVTIVATPQQEAAFDTAIEQWGFEPPVDI